MPTATENPILGGRRLPRVVTYYYQRKPWLNTDERRDLFLNILEEVRKEHRFVVLGYVVMPEHFHSFMSEPQVGTLSTAMQSVTQRYAQRVVPRRRQRRPAGTRPLQKTQGAGHPPCTYGRTAPVSRNETRYSKKKKHVTVITKLFLLAPR